MTLRSSRLLACAALVAALAGAARANLHGFVCQGHLFLLGDNSSDNLTLISDPLNVTVIGNSGTLVNGQPAFDFPGVTQTVWIYTAGGDDGLTINDCELPGSLVVFTGTGNDLVFSGRNVIAGSFLIEAGIWGAQSDLIVMTPPLGDASIVGGDLILVGRNLTVLARDQEVYGNTGVFTGPGTDLITLAASTFHGDVRIETDGGNDAVHLGDAADTVLNSFGGRLDVRLGSGNDHLVVRRSSVTGNARFSGDSGSDVIESAAAAYLNSYAASVLVAGFESAS